MKQMLLLCASLLVLSGCVMHQNPAKTKIISPYGTVEYKCPPGHAKKGECYSPKGSGQYKHRGHH
jgi:hypothetical protein